MKPKTKFEYDDKKKKRVVGILNIFKNAKSRKIKRQKTGTEIKILTQNKLLTILSILLPQIKAGKNSYKLKNEIKKHYILCISIIKSTKNFVTL